MQVGSMNDVNIPAHEAHLQEKNSRVVALVQLQKFNSGTVRDPDKLLPKDVVLHLVDGIIPDEAFAKMGV
jgi:hypothetical protein